MLDLASASMVPRAVRPHGPPMHLICDHELLVSYHHASVLLSSSRMVLGFI